MNKYQKEYIHRINRVMDFIDNHLGEYLTLEQLAQEALFSPYHFHRIFKAFTGETLNGYIKRVRVERAASLLLQDIDQPIIEIAYRCGYNSHSVFCRNFKQRFGISAQYFRQQWDGQLSKNSQWQSKNNQSGPSPEAYICDTERNKKWRSIMTKDFDVQEMPAMELIYCRHTGAFNQIGKAYEKLFQWAGPRGLLNQPEVKTVTVYHDDPKVTELDRVRQSASLIVTQPVKTDGEIGSMQLPGGKHFVGHFEIAVTEFEQAWDATCIKLSESGYQPRDGFPFELYHKDPEQHPDNKFVLDICIPVKPL